MEYLNEIAVNLLLENGSESLPVNMLEIASKNHDWLIKSYLEAAPIIQRLNLCDYAKKSRRIFIKRSRWQLYDSLQRRTFIHGT